MVDLGIKFFLVYPDEEIIVGDVLEAGRPLVVNSDSYWDLSHLRQKLDILVIQLYQAIIIHKTFPVRPGELCALPNLIVIVNFPTTCL
jgi:hypothetical protein